MVILLKEKTNSYIFFLVLLAFSIPFSMMDGIQWATLSLVLLILYWLATVKLRDITIVIKSNSLFWIISSIFFINSLGLLNTSNFQDGFHEINVKLSILVLPLILSTLPKLTKKQLNVIILCFIASLLLASLLTFVNGFDFNKFYTPKGYDLDELGKHIVLHRPYFALFISFAIFYLGQQCLFSSSFFIVKVSYALILIYLIWFLTLLYVKIILISIIGTTIFLLLIFLIKRKKWFWLLTFVLSSIILGFVLLKSFTNFESLFQKTLMGENLSWDEFGFNVANSINARTIFWDCSIKVFFQDSNWIFGVGTGDVQDSLISCYRTTNEYVAKGEFNSHNEYLQSALRNGVWGVFALLLSIFVALRISIKQQSYLYISFIVLLSISMLTDSMFSRMAGVLFYAFFNSLFALNYFRKSN